MTCPDYYCRCRYATYNGGCMKPGSVPCPGDEREMEAYEDAMERKRQEAIDDALCARREAQ